ncbi:hypothetical protein [Sphingomonas mesophila]|uniref:hypothetical protein n=1 Tax=Sphingomonas mesophila TaxID=2303576 RepID=UPI000E581147|nr:hypothetical protein [Sphingomonas mesophila]
MAIHRYRLFGLSIDSELELPELEATTGSPAGPPDLEIVLADDGGEGFSFEIDDVARYVVRDGCRIFIARNVGADDADVRLFLLGSAMGAALHQRGILPLHANAVEVDGRAIAFMGHSGAGKSTLAAWFHDRGYPVLADDVCVVRVEDGLPVAYPGLPRLRLWEDALEATGRCPTQHSPSFHRQGDERRKFDVPIPIQSRPASPLPLGAMFELEAGPEFAIRRLAGSAVVAALSANTYRGRLVTELGDSSAHVGTCVAIAQSVPLSLFVRPLDMRQFDIHAEAVLAYVRALPNG